MIVKLSDDDMIAGLRTFSANAEQPYDAIPYTTRCALMQCGLIQSHAIDTDDYGTRLVYILTLDGQETLKALNGTLPAIADDALPFDGPVDDTEDDETAKMYDVPNPDSFEFLLNVFGNTCYELGKAKDWLLPASHARQKCLDYVIAQGAEIAALKTQLRTAQDDADTWARMTQEKRDIPIRPGKMSRFNEDEGLYDIRDEEG